jgi:hypothetical protein
MGCQDSATRCQELSRRRPPPSQPLSHPPSPSTITFTAAHLHHRTSMTDCHAPPPPRTPQFHNLELSLFDGKEDLLGWLNRCEQYFHGQRAVEDKVRLASYHLTCAAQQWYHLLERKEPSLSWPRFKNFCHQRFGPALRQNALGELARLSFRTTVEDYQDRFMALLCHVAPLASEQQVQLFTAGLPDRININVELLNPPDLNTTLVTARAYECRSQSLQWGPCQQNRSSHSPHPTLQLREYLFLISQPTQPPPPAVNTEIQTSDTHGDGRASQVRPLLQL